MNKYNEEGKAPRGKTKPREAEPPHPRGTPEGQKPCPVPQRFQAKAPEPTTGESCRANGRKQTFGASQRGSKGLKSLTRGTTKTGVKGNSFSETQLNTPIDGRMAKQQPTSGEPEKLKAQAYFQEPNDE